MPPSTTSTMSRSSPRSSAEPTPLDDCCAKTDRYRRLATLSPVSPEPGLSRAMSAGLHGPAAAVLWLGHGDFRANAAPSQFAAAAGLAGPAGPAGSVSVTGPLPRPLPRTVVLVGLMGAGKSAIGRRLAARLGLAFVDADHEIEVAAGCSIEDIFETYGEAAFRDVERRVIKRCLHEPVHVLATGGGAFMNPETRGLIAERGISLWLRAGLDLLVARCSRRGNRPLLKRGDPQEILGRLVDERYPVYAQADIIVDSDDGPAEQTADRALAALRGFLESRDMPTAGD